MGRVGSVGWGWVGEAGLGMGECMLCVGYALESSFERDASGLALCFECMLMSWMRGIRSLSSLFSAFRAG